MERIKKIFVFLLTIIGIVLSLELCKIYYDANFNPYALSSFCSVNNVIDCDGVAKTSYSQFFGIPLCLWGLFFYSFIIFLFTAPFLAKFKIFKFAEVFKNPQAYIFCLSSLAFAISMCLAFISFFIINKICILCLITYFVDLFIALSTKNYKEKWYFELKTSIEDFKSAISIKKYLIAFIAVILLGIGILTYTSLSYVLTPQIKPLKLKYSITTDFETKDNTMGSENAKIIIHEYMDYNCASCYMVNLSLKRILSELNGIKVIQHNMPLDGECNPLVTKGHDGSCRMAKYALAAKKQGKYWEVNERLFDQTPDSDEKIIRTLKGIKGLNMKQLKADAASDEITAELKNEIEEGLKQNIEATPTIIINMEKITGNIPYYDLKEKLIKLGAEGKKQ